MNENAAETLALEALSWIVSDEDRLIAFLRLTGMTPSDLRANAGARTTLVAVLDFLMGRESDLLDCCASLNVPPEMPARARQTLSPQSQFE